MIKREYVFKRLKELGLTQLDFAEQSNQSLRNIIRFMNGEQGQSTPVLTWFKLAKGLQLDIKDLLLLERDYQYKRMKFLKGK